MRKSQSFMILHFIFKEIDSHIRPDFLTLRPERLGVNMAKSSKLSMIHRWINVVQNLAVRSLYYV